jgi:WD40 repeat protein
MIVRPNSCPNLAHSYLARGGQTGSLSVSHILNNRMLWQREEVHHGPIMALAWSLDGQFLASGDEDGMVHIWHALTGFLLDSFVLGEQVQRLQWSVQGTLAASSGTMVRLWNVQSTQAMAA